MTDKEWNEFLVMAIYLYKFGKKKSDWIIECNKLLTKHSLSSKEKVKYIIDAKNIIRKTFSIGCCYKSNEEKSWSWYERE